AGSTAAPSGPYHLFESPTMTSAMQRLIVPSRFLPLGLLAFLVCCCVFAQQSPPAAGAPPQPMNWTTAQDHSNMMEQLGIRALRPGPNGNEKAPDHANFDEAKANPYPDWPDPLTLNNGKKVTSAKVWWKRRRPEIVEDFE